MPVKLIFEKSSPGRKGYTLPKLDVPEKRLDELIPKRYLRRKPAELPEVSEIDIMRHFISLSVLNYHIEKGFYPLGSCTMKYNPKINEDTARLPGLAQIHPYQPQGLSQGALQLMHELGEYLKEISGLDAITLQPAAGAQGELTGLMIIRTFHEKKGNPREKVIIPDSAHGTNPASVSLAGYETVTVRSNDRGTVDVERLREMMDENVAALMLTNPNTLGKFESDIVEVSKIVHDAGALLYMDGANLNALVGATRPGDMGFDILHINLHKTFSTPHGGGGPGSGPVGVVKHLEKFLPVPIVNVRNEKGTKKYFLDYDRPESIGKIQGFYGNFGMMVRAYTYIRLHGPDGLKKISRAAVLNSNYLMKKLEPYYELPYPGPCMHECVFSGDRQSEKGVKTTDVAKRLLDYGVHSPTIYFPLIVHEALMIETAETESRESIDGFVDAMIKIAEEVETDPDTVRSAPHTTPLSRLDEALAGRKLNIRWKGNDKE